MPTQVLFCLIDDSLYVFVRTVSGGDMKAMTHISRKHKALILPFTESRSVFQDCLKKKKLLFIELQTNSA